MISKILNYSLNNSSYYRNLNIDCCEINNFPILTKKIYNDNVKEILADSYTGLNINKLQKVRTSGTSGLFTEIYWAKEDKYLSNISLWRLRKKFYNVTPTSKYCSFYSSVNFEDTTSEDNLLFKKINSHHLSFSKYCLNENNIMTLCNEISRFSPEWLFVQPSAIITFINILEHKKVNLDLKNLKYIECFGEVLLSGAKKKIEEYFKVPIGNMYGTIELNTIGFTCPFGHMHILDKNVYVEQYNDNKILVTSLTNKATPMIRYLLDDYVILEKNYNCKCGINGDIIKELNGRINHTFQYEGININMYEINSIVEYCNELLGNLIIEYCFYLENKKIILYVNSEFLSWQNTIIKEFKKCFKKMFKLDSSINVFVDVHFEHDEDKKYVNYVE